MQYLYRLWRRLWARPRWESAESWSCNCSPDLRSWPWDQTRKACLDCGAKRPSEATRPWPS